MVINTMTKVNMIKLKNQKPKKAFSLMELIFAIAIISVIAIVAIPKLGSSLDKTNLIKIKSDITLIRDGIISYKNKSILSNSDTTLDTLESGDKILFDKILFFPIIPSSTHKATSWEKISDDTYKVYINSSISLEFEYDKDEYTFDCDFKDDYCEELTQ